MITFLNMAKREWVTDIKAKIEKKKGQLLHELTDYVTTGYEAW